MSTIIDRRLIEKMYTTTLFTDLNVAALSGSFTCNVPVTFPLDEVIITQLTYNSSVVLEGTGTFMLACDFPVGTQYIASFTKGTSANLDTRINMMKQTINQQLVFRVYQIAGTNNIPGVVSLAGQLALTMTFIKYVPTV